MYDRVNKVMGMFMNSLEVLECMDIILCILFESAM